MFNLSSEVYFLIFYMFIFLFSLHVNQVHTIGFIWEQKRTLGNIIGEHPSTGEEVLGGQSL